MTKTNHVLSVIREVTVNCIIIRESFDPPYNFYWIGNTNNVEYALASIMLDYITIKGVIYYYFDRKYEEQIELNPSLVGEVLISKYPNNILNNLIKEYL